MTTDLALYIKRPNVIQQFQDVLGRGANGYVQSVIIASQSNDELMKCTEISIVRAALRAASLGLSCDPAQREAHLVPRNKNVGSRDNPSWVKEASFEIHYLGLYKLAIRTGKYWTINVIPINKKQDVMMGIDGLHYVYEGNTKIDHFPVSRVTAKNLPDVKGWLGYFKTTKGFEKTSYMTVEEIMEHAEKFSKSYQKDIQGNSKKSKWSDPDILPTMQMKTVLRDLLKWADTSGDAGAPLAEALKHDSDDVIEADLESVDSDPFALDQPREPRSESENTNGSELDSDFPPIPQTKTESLQREMETISNALPRESAEPGCTPQFLVNENLYDNVKHAAAIMQLLGIPDGAPADASLKRVKAYLAWRKVEGFSRNDPATREKAAAKAIAGEIPA